MSKQQRIVVNIYNEQYALKSGLSQERVEKLAQDVDKRMQRIASVQPTLSSARIAVLVALELADEALSNQESYDSIINAIKKAHTA